MQNERGNVGLKPLLVRALLLPVLVVGLGAAVHQAPPEQVCAETAERIESQHGIPPGLVQAVALAESGRWDPDRRRSYAWPWTITSKSDTYYLPSKAAALAKVRELQARGRRNIDVGCMQINLMWHGDSFTSVEEAIEPRVNVTYGADFLKRLRSDTRSWSRATARYHSSNPERGNAYRAKVFRLWEDVREAIRSARADEPQPADLSPRPRSASLARRIGSPGIGGATAIGPATAAPGAIPILRGW